VQVLSLNVSKELSKKVDIKDFKATVKPLASSRLIGASTNHLKYCYWK
jgi:hypothetical protein